MSVTGDVHGSALYFTHLVAMSDVMRWRNIGGSNWEAADIETIITVNATAIGTENGRHLAKFYASNIQVKYNRVDTLIRDAPVPDPGWTNCKFNRANYSAGLTGANGFGSTEKIRTILAGLMNMWGLSQSTSG